MACSSYGRNVAIRQSQRLVRAERILAGGQWRQLVELALDGQVRSLATHISKIGNDILGKFSLYAETPLLSVRPNCLGRNSCHIERKHRASGWGGMDGVQGAGAVARIKCNPIADIANARIIERKRLRHAEDERRASLQGTGIGFVARAMLKENAVTAANRRLAITPRIPRKTNPGSGIKQMPIHTAGRNTVDTALNQTEVAHYAGVQLESARIERYRGRASVLIEKHATRWVYCKSCWIEFCRFPVPCIVIFLAVSAKQTDPQAQIQRKSRNYFPVVLEVRLTDLVSLVIATLRRILSEALDVACGNTTSSHRLNQEVSEGIPRAVRQIAESQQPLNVAGSSPDRVVGLIALRKYVLASEMQRMLAHRFANLITQCIGRIRVAPRHV